MPQLFVEVQSCIESSECVERLERRLFARSRLEAICVVNFTATRVRSSAVLEELARDAEEERQEEGTEADA